MQAAKHLKLWKEVQLRFLLKLWKSVAPSTKPPARHYLLSCVRQALRADWAMALTAACLLHFKAQLGSWLNHTLRQERADYLSGVASKLRACHADNDAYGLWQQVHKIFRVGGKTSRKMKVQQIGAEKSLPALTAPDGKPLGSSESIAIRKLCHFLGVGAGGLAEAHTFVRQYNEQPLDKSTPRC